MRQNEAVTQQFQLKLEKPLDGDAVVEAIKRASTGSPDLINIAESNLLGLTDSDLPKTAGGWVSDVAKTGMKEVLADPEASAEDRKWAAFYLSDMGVIDLEVDVLLPAEEFVSQLA